MPDYGDPIAYTVLAEGTPVLTSDGAQVATVVRVLADEGTDIFDGIVVDTDDGERFVDAPEVASIYERAVILTIYRHRIDELSEPTPGPAVVDVAPDDITDADKPGESLARKTWDRLTGNY